MRFNGEQKHASQTFSVTHSIQFNDSSYLALRCLLVQDLLGCLCKNNNISVA